jgi:hypothetical protein
LPDALLRKENAHLRFGMPVISEIPRMVLADRAGGMCHFDRRPQAAAEKSVDAHCVAHCFVKNAHLRFGMPPGLRELRRA